MERFVYAQTNYSKIVRELKNAKKETHWMWFIFPQLDGLVPNPSHMSKYYAIKSGNDAKEFLKHPILGKRLVKVTNIILKLEETNPEIIFGKTDSVKLQSSLTLFDAVGRHKCFEKALDKFFRGEKDNRTIELLQLENESV
jgi:uncharacterized protein (DUF1810 family)